MPPPPKSPATAGKSSAGAPGDTWHEVEPHAGGTPAQTTSGTPLDVGDRYADLGAIGAGGWGEVRRVRDPRLMRVLARKALHAKLASSSEAVARFLEEARVTAYLDHPGVVPVHELGRNGDGTWYFTMKEVRGRTLASILAARADDDDVATGEWPLVRVVEVFRRCCEAVAYAHARGVIHRDLKPGNMMVGEFGEAVVLDWGLARRSAEEERRPLSSGDPTLDRLRQATPTTTLAGTRVGTPQYMSPEHASGIPGRVDARSDVFSLGCILYEILTRRQALSGETVGDLLSAAAMASVRPIRPDEAPAELISIVTKALSREPLERYPTAEGMAADLAAWLSGAPVRAHHYSTVGAIRRFVGRHRAAFAVAGVAAVILALSGSLAVLRLADERDRALTAENAATAALSGAMAERAEAANDGLLRPDADLLAAEALAHGEEPLARGVVVALAARQPPKLAWEGWAADSRAAVAFTEDGHGLYVLDAFGQLTISDLATTGPARQIGSLTGTHLTLEPTPGGLLVGGGAAAAARLINPATMGVLHVIGDAAPGARAVHVIDVGRSAVGIVGDDVVAWSLDDGHVLGRYAGQPGLRDVSATATAVVATGPTTIETWSRDPTVPAPVLPDADLGPAVIRASPDGRWLVAGGAGGARRGLAIWGITGAPTSVDLVDPPEGQVRTLAWSPDSTVLAIGLDAGVVELRLAPDWRRVVALHATEGAVTGLAFRADGQTLATADPYGHLRTWDVSGVARSGEWVVDRRPLLDLASAVTGEIATLTAGGTVVVRGPDGTERRRFEVGAEANGGLAWVAGDTDLALTGAGDGVTLVDGQTGAVVRSLAGGPGRTTSLAVSRDGTVLAAAGAYDGIALWDLHTGTLLAHVQSTHDTSHWALAFSPDGHWLAAPGEDGTVALVDVTQRALATTLTASGLQAYAVAFSADSATLAIGTRRGTTELWDVATQRRTTTLAGPAASMEALLWSADGDLLFSATDTGGVAVWRGERLIAQIPVPAPVRAIAATPTGLVAITAAGRLYRWPLASLATPAATVQHDAGAWSGMRLAGDQVAEDPDWRM